MTNLVVGSERISRAADVGLVRTLSEDPGGVLLFEERGVQRVYFLQGTADAVIAALRKAAPAFDGRTVIDVTSHMGKPSLFDEILRHAGFEPYKNFLRMSRRPMAVEAIPDADIIQAEEHDIDTILHEIETTFDPLAEFLPARADLEGLLGGGGILTMKTDTGDIRGFLAHEAVGNVSLLRYVAVAPQERGKGLGGTLIAQYLLETIAAVRHDLWVWERNKTAIKRYLAVGFEFTGQYNATYIFKE